jgi:hypothetical protein
MASKVTYQSANDIQLVIGLGATSQYVDGPVKEFYPAIHLESVVLPNDIKFKSVFRLLGEPSLPTKAAAKTRALELLCDTLCQGITDAILETYAVEP